MTDIIELQPHDDDMDGFQFVLRAMKDRIDPKAQLCHHNCVKIIDGKIIGTDGKRVHIYDYKEPYKNGIYRVLKALKTHVILNPADETNDYKKPFPPIDDIMVLFDQGEEIDAVFADSDYGIIKALTSVIRALKSWETVNPKYLKDLDDAFICTIDPNKQMLFFKGNLKTAYISKMKFEE